ncbi:jg18446 [Pararge aegeria aegeria]|uniref:Jg18446 protein n=1 Tax=Pararge aegeria aegeria TaxID=348720 RepID=A0A8S4SF56_9NEOP|nr:jg18446 [Pararge aegeria aegeria]
MMFSEVCKIYQSAFGLHVGQRGEPSPSERRTVPCSGASSGLIMMNDDDPKYTAVSSDKETVMLCAAVATRARRFGSPVTDIGHTFTALSLLVCCVDCLMTHNSRGHCN